MMRITLMACCLLVMGVGSALAADWQITQLDNGLKVMILELGKSTCADPAMFVSFMSLRPKGVSPYAII